MHDGDSDLVEADSLLGTWRGDAEGGVLGVRVGKQASEVGLPVLHGRGHDAALASDGLEAEVVNLESLALELEGSSLNCNL